MMMFSFVEYESFSFVFDVDVGLDVDLCAEYEYFSFDPIITDPLFESRKSEFVESETFVPMIADLDQTLANIELKELVDLGSTILPRLLIPADNHISRPITTLLADTEYIYLISNWAQLFDKLKLPLLVFH